MKRRRRSKKCYDDLLAMAAFNVFEKAIEGDLDAFDLVLKHEDSIRKVLGSQKLRIEVRHVDGRGFNLPLPDADAGGDIDPDPEQVRAHEEFEAELKAMAEEEAQEERETFDAIGN